MSVSQFGTADDAKAMLGKAVPALTKTMNVKGDATHTSDSIKACCRPMGGNYFSGGRIS